MKKGLFQIFSADPAPRGLYAAVMRHIASAERHAARVRVSIAGGIALVSFVALIPITQYTLEQFAASGFYTYLSLLFSDSSSVMTFGNEFALSLIESLPSLALLGLLPLAAALVWSLRRVTTNARAAFIYS